jgi:hypothetical protein
MLSEQYQTLLRDNLIFQYYKTINFGGIKMTKMKSRVLYFPENNKKLSLLSRVLCDKLQCKLDKIPPAYPCENEKLVLIGVSMKNDMPDALRRFCRELVKTRAQNVAFFGDAPETTMVNLMNEAREAGTNVIGDVFECKTGGLPFLARVKPEEQTGIEEWLKKVLEQLK